MLQTTQTLKELTAGISITKRKEPVKKPVYTGTELQSLLNEKFNWLCANTHAIFAKQNARLHDLLKTMATQTKSIIGGYEMMLLMQEGTPKEEGILLTILRDIKKRTTDPPHVLGYIFDFDRDGEEDGGDAKYDDHVLKSDLDGYSMLMMAASRNLWKIAKYLYVADETGSALKQEVYHSDSGKYHSIYTFALACQTTDQIGFLTALFQKAKSTETIFWDRVRMGPQELVDHLKSKTTGLDHRKSPTERELLTKIFELMEMVVVAHPDHFVDNQLYLDFARNHQNEALLAMLRHGEINPMYTDRETGNTAFLYATISGNMELFEMLLYTMPLSYLVQKNAEGKAAIDYLPTNARGKKVQQMGAMLRSYLKFLLERPKLVIMNGKDTIYVNPNIPTSSPIADAAEQEVPKMPEVKDQESS